MSEDLRAIPALIRNWRMWFPLAFLLIGFVLALLIYNMPADLQQWIALYLQYFFVPQGLVVYLIAGAIAPRASYLVGLILGVLSGFLYGVAIVATLPVGWDVPSDQAVLSIVSYMLTGAILGFFASGFAGLIRYLILASGHRDGGPVVG